LVVEARSDVVGSLLRPPRLLAARERFAAGGLSTADLKAMEDDAVDEALRLPEDAGVAVVTDGEMRRLSFQSQVPAAVEGFSDWDLDAFLWGDRHGDQEVGDLRVERPDLAVIGKLRRRRSLCAEELAYARGRTDLVLKVTLPSPSLFANFWDPGRARPDYRTPEDFLADVAEIIREEADELEAWEPPISSSMPRITRWCSTPATGTSMPVAAGRPNAGSSWASSSTTGSSVIVRG
jgi:5-methyltetrahydropteroyltriglutamate--homocysteine methyltransferase